MPFLRKLAHRFPQWAKSRIAARTYLATRTNVDAPNPGPASK